MEKNKPPKLLYRDGSPMRTHKSKIIEELMNEDKQQTAVEWLVEQMIKEISKHLSIEISQQGMDLINQAKVIEKDQHRTTWLDAQIEKVDENYHGKVKTFEEYYNEIYGTE